VNDVMVTFWYTTMLMTFVVLKPQLIRFNMSGYLQSSEKYVCV